MSWVGYSRHASGGTRGVDFGIGGPAGFFKKPFGRSRKNTLRLYRTPKTEASTEAERSR